MPHLTLEYSANLTSFDAAAVLPPLNRALIASGQFAEIDIKARALRLDTFLVGTGSGEHAFIHLKLALLSGRAPEIKRNLSDALLQVLRQHGAGLTPAALQLSVEVVDLDRDCYAKSRLDG